MCACARFPATQRKISSINQGFRIFLREDNEPKKSGKRAGSLSHLGMEKKVWKTMENQSLASYLEKEAQQETEPSLY